MICPHNSPLKFKKVTLFPLNGNMGGRRPSCMACQQKIIVTFRFLDTRLFATCSDDTTVALWDARYLKSRLRTLSGHSHWVKNIEFSYKENCLVTSGFDGAIYLWDINRFGY